MTKQKQVRSTEEAMKLALEALTHLQPSALTSFYTIGDRDKAITALREALAEQPQKPKKFDPNESFEREEAAQARVREFMRNH